jgi:hypothetical protein
MSRGHGRIERLILEALHWDRREAQRGKFAMGATAKLLVDYVRADGKLYTMDDPYYVNPPRPRPTRAELESVRRALRNLRRQGLIATPIKYRQVVYQTPGVPLPP